MGAIGFFALFTMFFHFWRSLAVFFGYIYVHSLVLKIFFDVFESCFLWCCSSFSLVLVWFFSPEELIRPEPVGAHSTDMAELL